MSKKFFFIFIAVIAVSAKAQLCQGSLGDPVVDINFGAGNNPGPALSYSVTSYQYLAADCPNDGQYAIRNSTEECFGFTWYSLINDHTGNPNGYFMLVNASFQPGDFFVDTVHGLCPNTTFEFAAWIVNILSASACQGQGGGIQPNITFNIETTGGTVIASYNTGNIPSANAQWQQYGFYFKTSAGESDVVIRMRNNAPGGCGNDLALDDITFRPCGSAISASINNNATDTVDVCEGKVFTYTFTGNVSPGYANPSFQWQENNGSGWVDIPGATDTFLTKQFSAAGNYQFRLAVADQGNIGINNCRINSNLLSVNIHPKPADTVSVSGSQCIDHSLALSVAGGDQYLWSGPNNFSSTDSAIIFSNLSLADAGKYFVSVITNFGCKAFDSIIISANPNPVASVRSDTTICAGKTVLLEGSGGTTYLWKPAAGLSSDTIANPSAIPKDTTTYLLTVANQFDCIDTASVNINVVKLAVADAGNDKAILQGESVLLNGSVANASSNSYYWLPDIYIDNPVSLAPLVDPPQDITYTLFAVSYAGCGIASDNVFVKVYQKLSIPNAFSPNGDGINDTWKITKLETYPQAEVFIFNRYGQTVFHSVNYSAWNGTINGKPLPTGTYYYLIDLKVNLIPKLSGWLEIVR